MKKLYNELFGVDEIFIDLIAVEDIIKRCVTGQSIGRIARKLKEYNQEYVRGVLDEYLGFEGWIYDLDFNPLALYNRVNGNKELFEQELKMNSALDIQDLREACYLMCQNYKIIRSYMDEQYSRVTRF